MSVLDVQVRDAIATVVLQRGKVNAINPTVVEELSTAFAQLQRRCCAAFHDCDSQPSRRLARV